MIASIPSPSFPKSISYKTACHLQISCVEIKISNFMNQGTATHTRRAGKVSSH